MSMAAQTKNAMSPKDLASSVLGDARIGLMAPIQGDKAYSVFDGFVGAQTKTPHKDPETALKGALDNSVVINLKGAVGGLGNEASPQQLSAMIKSANAYMAVNNTQVSGVSGLAPRVG